MVVPKHAVGSVPGFLVSIVVTMAMILGTEVIDVTCILYSLNMLL